MALGKVLLGEAPFFYADAKTSNIPDRRHILAGTVLVNGLPKQKRVTVLTRSNYEYVGSTWSDKDTGEWELSHLPEYPEKSLVVLITDDTGVFNLESLDFVSQTRRE